MLKNIKKILFKKFVLILLFFSITFLLVVNLGFNYNSVVKAAVNLISNPSFEDATFNLGWVLAHDAPILNTTAQYVWVGNNSVKIDNFNSSFSGTNNEFYTTVNTGNSNIYSLFAYVYDETPGNVGGTVNSSINQLYQERFVTGLGWQIIFVNTTYTNVGGGWWKMTGNVTGSNSNSHYGVVVKPGKINYVDEVHLEAISSSSSAPVTSTPPLSSSSSSSIISGSTSSGTITTSNGSIIASTSSKSSIIVNGPTSNSSFTSSNGSNSSIDEYSLLSDGSSSSSSSDSNTLLMINNLLTNRGNSDNNQNLIISLIPNITELIKIQPYITTSSFITVSTFELSLLLAYPNGGNAISHMFFDFIWFHKRKRKNRFGIIYDSKTKKVLPFALIRVLSIDTKKIVKDTVSDLNGRYSILVDPGLYLLRVEQQSFTSYNQPYDATKEGYEQITENVGLDPIQDPQFVNINLRKTILQISNLIFYFGLIVSIVMFLLNFGFETTIILVLYLIQILILILLREPRGWGVVYYAETGLKIPGVFVSIYDKVDNRQINSQITDKLGRFGFILEDKLCLFKVGASGYEFIKMNKDLPKQVSPTGETFYEIQSSEVGGLNISMKKDNSSLTEKKAFY